MSPITWREEGRKEKEDTNLSRSIKRKWATLAESLPFVSALHLKRGTTEYSVHTGGEKQEGREERKWFEPEEERRSLSIDLLDKNARSSSHQIEGRGRRGKGGGGYCSQGDGERERTPNEPGVQLRHSINEGRE